MRTDGRMVLVMAPQLGPGERFQAALSDRGLDGTFIAPATAEEMTQKALELLECHRFAVLLAAWPVEGAIDRRTMALLAAARTHRPHCRLILLGASAEGDEVFAACARRALVLGAYDCLPASAAIEQLADGIQAAATADETDPSPLARRIAVCAADGPINQTTEDAIQPLADLARVIDARNPHTIRHSEQVSLYAVQLARAMNLDSRACEVIRVAALAHDIGMIGAPDWVLTKTETLSEKEFQLIRRHPAYGAQMLLCISTFGEEAELVRHHHERWDGSGYPDGLAGEQIPLGSRIIQVADCIDAMLMDRSYKAAYPVERMLNELTRCAGTQFDPRVAAVAVRWARMHEQDLVRRQEVPG